MSLSEEIKAVHGEIMAFLPTGAFVVIQHSYRNYKDRNVEEWTCQAYESDENPLESLFHTYGCDAADKLVNEARECWEKAEPDREVKVAERIAALEKQLAKLRGEDANNEQ